MCCASLACGGVTMAAWTLPLWVRTQAATDREMSTRVAAPPGDGGAVALGLPTARPL